MADLKKTIEERIVLIPRIHDLFPEGISMDESRAKHIKFDIKKIKNADDYDIDDCVVTIKSDKQLVYRIHAKIIMDIMFMLEGVIALPHFRKIILNGIDYQEDGKKIDVKFILIHNIDH